MDDAKQFVLVDFDVTGVYEKDPVREQRKAWEDRVYLKDAFDGADAV